MKTTLLITAVFTLIPLFSAYSMETEEEGSSPLHLSQLSNYSDQTLSQANAAFFSIEDGEEEKALEPLKYAAEHRVRPSMCSYARCLLSEKYLSRSKTPLEDIKKASDYLLMSAYRGWEDALAFLDDLNPTVFQLTGTPETAADLVKIERTNGKTLQELWTEIDERILKKWLEGKKPDDPSLKNLLDLTEIALFSTLPPSFIAQMETEITKKFGGLFPNSDPLTPYVPIAFHEHAKNLGIETSASASYGPGLNGSSQIYLNTKHKIMYAYDVTVRRLNFVSSQKFLREKPKKTPKPTKKKVVLAKKPIFLSFQAVGASCAAMAAGPVYEGLREQPLSRENSSQKSDKPSKKSKNYHVSEEHDFFIKPIYRSLSDQFVQKKTARPHWLVELTHLDAPYKNVIKWMSGRKDFKKGINITWPDPSQGDIGERRKAQELNKKYTSLIEQFIASDQIKESILYRLSLVSLYQLNVLNAPEKAVQDKDSKPPKKQGVKRKKSKEEEEEETPPRARKVKKNISAFSS